MKHPKYSHSFEVVSELPEPIRALRDLAMNFRWTWHHETRNLYRELDKTRWDASEHNPVTFLASIPKERLEKVAADPVFLSRLEKCRKDLEAYMAAETWFDRSYPGRREDTLIAYFCAEFGVSEGLPIYSGGLGVLAGDHLKAASDLGLPLVGIGLLYARGYFRQYLSPDNWQQERYPEYDFHEMPLTLLRGDDGQPMRVSVEFPDREVTCHIWKAQVGRVSLYLLDSNVLENAPMDQGITDTLYGGDEEMRMRQEMILGMGGMRALRKLGLNPTVCHMNEGHAAFLAIERIRQCMADHQCDFPTARQVLVKGNVFTTHTPVPAGFDVFQPEMLARYLGTTANKVGEPMPGFLRFGRFDAKNEAEHFNMAVLAMENSNHVNGVSELHAAVSRSMFQTRWKDYPEDEVPVDAITNGIHTLTWVSQRFADIFEQYLGSGWRDDPADPKNWEGIWNVPDEVLWKARQDARGDLVRFSRKHLAESMNRRGLGVDGLREAETVLDPRILTIGFARRFATYKRATLMLQDKERLKKLLFHPERPVQFVIAGKSHPRDDGGKKLIQDLVNFMNFEGARARMVFLEDYDMRVARALVQGVDVWLNNPRRPMEASGTSGMKVVPNGALNCSILDGWWDEGYEKGVGWAIGDRTDVADEGHQDWLDSRTLYHLIESEITPTFYHRGDGAVPASWIEMVKRSIATLAPRFSTARMVQDYANKFYMPASSAFLSIQEGGLKKAKDALAWRDRVQAAWSGVRVLRSDSDGGVTSSLGSEFGLTAEVELGSLNPTDVKVEAVLGKVSGNRDLVNTEVVELGYGEAVSATAHRFSARVRCDAPGHRGFVVRVVPAHPDVDVSHELPLVAWEGS